MSADARFALIPLERLRAHEEIDASDVEPLAAEIRAEGVLAHPIWVAAGSWVILNGHHRVAALRRLGAARAPAWVLDYHSPRILVDRWSPGPPISKREIEQRAREGRLFPPKTTKHLLELELPDRPTPLPELLAPAPAPRQARAPSGRAAAGE